MRRDWSRHTGGGTGDGSCEDGEKKAVSAPQAEASGGTHPANSFISESPTSRTVRKEFPLSKPDGGACSGCLKKLIETPSWKPVCKAMWPRDR